LVDPRWSWEREDFGISGCRESFGVFHAGCGEGCRAFFGDAGSVAVVDVRGRVEADAGVLVVMVVQSTKPLMNAPASWTEEKRSGNSGPYFRVLNSASL
jgi:hypothetical protein